MDPVSAVGLAAAVVQFVQFTSGLLKGTHDIYKSIQGSSKASLELDDVYQRLYGFSSALQNRICSEPVTMLAQLQDLETETSLNELASSCQAACEELLSVVGQVRVSGSRHRLWRSFKAAIGEVLKQTEIQHLQERIDRLKSDMMLHLSAISHKNIQVLREEVNGLRVQNIQLGSAHTADLGRIFNLIIDVSNELNKMSVQTQGIDGDSLKMESLTARLSALSLKSRDISVNTDILSSLEYPQRHMRHQNVPEAHAKTFSWALKGHNPAGDTAPEIGESDLRQWLESGNGIFWISGKPGSGKSTFTKFVADHSETRSLLSAWASPRRAIIASHYFWSIGTPMQRSQQGLWQSLLFSILSKIPEALPQVCKERWQESLQNRLPQGPWGIQELRSCFSRLSYLESGSTRFCIFIDGLDEFDGDHSDIAETLVALSCSGSIKMCVSSRPWNVFKWNFGQPHQPKMYIHDLTRNDILAFINSRLSQHPRWSIVVDLPDAEQLVLDIASRAQGVFLWVFLITKLLREGLTNDDSLSDLRRTLDSIPPDLELFFKKILDSVSHVYHTKMAGFLEMTVESFCPLDAAIYHFHEMEYDDVDYALKEPISVWQEQQAEDARQRTARRLDAFCKGLLEVGVCNEVSYIHRTVADWLRTAPIRAYLREKAKPGFSAKLSIIRAQLAWYKHPPAYTGTRVGGQHNLEWEGEGWDRLDDALSMTGDYSQHEHEHESDSQFATAVNRIFDEYCAASLEIFRGGHIELRPEWDEHRSGADFILKFQSTLLENFDCWRYLVHKVHETPGFLTPLAACPTAAIFPLQQTVPSRMLGMRSQIATSLLGLHLAGVAPGVFKGDAVNMDAASCENIRTSYEFRLDMVDEGADSSCSIVASGEYLPVPAWLFWLLLVFKLEPLEQHPLFVETLQRLCPSRIDPMALLPRSSSGMSHWDLLCRQISGLRRIPEEDLFRIHFIANVLRVVLDAFEGNGSQPCWDRLIDALKEGLPPHLSDALSTQVRDIQARTRNPPLEMPSKVRAKEHKLEDETVSVRESQEPGPIDMSSTQCTIENPFPASQTRSARSSQKRARSVSSECEVPRRTKDRS
ncbi:hypothetical protein diail_8160 [Diaporthe ilicicola]|nr:hypothetical protein diail_8160 [Diaporthe ilicicola]